MAGKPTHTLLFEPQLHNESNDNPFRPLNAKRRLRSTQKLIWACLLLLAFAGQGRANNDVWPIITAGPKFSHLSSQALRAWMDGLQFNADSEKMPLATIDEPASGTLFPRDMAAPQFEWHGNAAQWLLRIELEDRTLLRALLATRTWIAAPKTWQRIKTEAGQRLLNFRIAAVGGWDGRQVGPVTSVSFSISDDPVEADIFFLQMPVPFGLAQAHPQWAQWRLGAISDTKTPQVVMQHQQVCGNCHTFSKDGSTFGMDMDVDGDKGAFIWTGLGTQMAITREQTISWNRLPAPAPAKFSYGLFARLSPDGRYAAATVGETSLFVMLDHPDFSQLFFPVTGRLAYFDRQSGNVALLPGAARENFVQTAPEWSPDGRSLLFSRAKIDEKLVTAVESGQVRQESHQNRIEDLNAKYPIRFDICSIPFSGGKGGRAELLKGASQNGRSNFFPRYSPDRRFIVFTQSPTGMVLQPQSRLMILPVGGPSARPLASNLPEMNSWHSFSPNGRWLVFSGKRRSEITELYLTHLDLAGRATPAIRLSRFSRPGYACVIPEFLPAGAVRPQQMGLAFETTVKKAPEPNQR